MPRTRLELGAWPLNLPRVVAVATVRCSRCETSQDVEVLAGADWLDHQGLATQTEQAQGLACRHCGGAMGLPVPLIQHRDRDGVELVVALPMTTSADADREWIREIIAQLRPYVDSARVVTVRSTWWAAVSTTPLGPVLAGLAPIPDLPETEQETRAWITSTRAALDLPDVGQALGRFVSASTVEQAREIFDAQPALSDLGWRSSVEVAGQRLLDAQNNDEQREVVAQRLSRLRQMVVNLQPDATKDAALTAAVQRAVDAAVALPVDDPDRVAVIGEAVDLLRPLGPTRLLAAALTSLLASAMAAPQRSLDDWQNLWALADESTTVCRQVFGDEHEATVSNLLNQLVLRQEQPGASAEDIREVCRAYEQLAGTEAVKRTGHVADVLNNLASALVLRRDLARGERLEQTLTLFEGVEHVTRLVHPGDVRTRVLALVNQAAILRQRLVGARLRNLERAWGLLDQAQELAQSGDALRPAERVLLQTNTLNLAYSLHLLAPDPARSQQLRESVQAAVDAVAILDEDNEIAITTLLNAGSVLVDLHVESIRAGAPWPGLLERADSVLTSAVDRCSRNFPPGHRIRLTAQLNLAAVYGAPTGHGVKDVERAAELYRRVAEDAEGHSLDHAATAMTNLGTLMIGQGRWSEAADAYASARSARAELVDQTAGRGTRLGEVISSGDLAAREALCHVRLGRLDDAVRTLEDSRANLLRHRFQIPDAAELPQRPGRVILHLASCNLGTIAIVHAQGAPRAAVYGSQASGSISAVVTALLNARTRIDRILAFDRIESSLRDLLDAIAGLIPAEATEICVVACGPLAGAPLHALTDTGGRTWLDRWTVRYWPTGTVAAHLGEPETRQIKRALAITALDDDLPLTATEVDALTAFCSDVTTPPSGWSPGPWLRGRLPHVDLAHFACHARADLVDPTGSRFEFSATEVVTIDELLDGPSIDNVQLVLASACQSGAPAVDAPDELLGIGYGLIHAGARAAITTQWEIQDLPAALLIARFYHQLSGCSHPAQALRAAQRWLAALSNADLARLGRQHSARAWLPDELARELRRHVGNADPDDRPFRHGSDWGAFTYLGA